MSPKGKVQPTKYYRNKGYRAKARLLSKLLNYWVEGRAALLPQPRPRPTRGTDATPTLTKEIDNER